jgi:uncharacterized protein (DUF58 family)
VTPLPSRSALRQRLNRWWVQRHPPADSVLLAQRNVYIVPTRGGWLWALMVLALLLGAINYQLNLGYLLCFVLAGVALVSMHSCHATLRGLRLSLAPPEPVFAGAQALLPISLVAERGSAAPRYGIGLRLQTDPADAWIWTALTTGAPGTPVPPGRDARPAAELALPLACARRGHQALPRLVIETRFPFGLFRAWSYWQPAAQVLVWPAPEQPAPPWPQAPAAASTADARLAASSRSEDPVVADGVRPYRAGDSPRQVAWKKSASALNSGVRHALVSRSGAAQAAQISLALSWAQAAAAGPAASAATRRPVDDAEARLARLCAWVLAADAARLAWSLQLPGHTLGAGSGAAHRRACLDALARHEATP